MQKINPSLFTVRPLTADVDVSSFHCSEEELTEYLQDNALLDKENLYSITKVVEYDGKVVGYFSLITDSVDIATVDDDIVRKYAYRKLPALKIARLATDKEFVGRGVGKYMMRCIFVIALNLIEDVGFRVLTVDAKAGAQSFYESFTFETVNSKKKHDFIPMYMDVGALINNS